ncbi:hypothetical protein [Flavobacterium sp. 102]|uniref:hypothetical protein n=1 Tax=Flavobacterium sp. 102 TaxID=2135623 RepID=UPI000EB40A9A|nr:hypothetical protein [Flavobacterium sp. 102]RKS00414.1 hypothetical protein C8C84_0022 [Flavobacterium sp. 102]
MIYKNLRTLPKVTQLDIMESGDLNLLCSAGEEVPMEELIAIWVSIQEEFNNRYNKQKSSKVFNLYREIEYLEKKYTIIKCAVDALEFDVHEELIELLQGYGYKLRKEFYIEDLKRIERESEAIVIKINRFVDQLPKPKQESEQSDFSIIETMGTYSTILGYDFDFYSISVEKFHALEIQIKNKVAAIHKNNTKNSK